MTVVSDYILELKSIVMLSQVESKIVKLEEYVKRLEESIRTDNKGTVDQKIELELLNRAYQVVLEEIIGFVEKS